MAQTGASDIQIPHADDASGILSRRILFTIGLALSLMMFWRTQVSGDQLNELARGWIFAREGKLIPYGEGMSGGGMEPGSLTSFLIGVPLMLWPDYHAPIVIILLCHLIAYLLLDTLVGEIYSERARTLFCIFYWLNPWRLFYSGFLWNPNYLLLAGAVHLWTIYRQRERSSFVYSFLLVIALGLSSQLHASATILYVTAFILWVRRYFKVNWPGAICGGLLILLSLVPWLQALMTDAALVPVSQKHNFIGRGLLYIFPMVRGFTYLIRFCSYAVNRRMHTYDLTTVIGHGLNHWITPVFYWFETLLAIVTLGIAVAAYWWFMRQAPSFVKAPRRAPESPPDWMRGYAMWSIFGAMLTFALSPVTVMTWQVIIIMHVAVLPLFFWVMDLEERKGRALINRRLRLYLAAALPMLLVIGLGAPEYRIGGKSSVGLPLRYDHPMFHELHILENSDMHICSPDCGFWIDVFPDPLHTPAHEHVKNCSCGKL